MRISMTKERGLKKGKQNNNLHDQFSAKTTCCLVFPIFSSTKNRKKRDVRSIYRIGITAVKEPTTSELDRMNRKLIAFYVGLFKK